MKTFARLAIATLLVAISFEASHAQGVLTGSPGPPAAVTILNRDAAAVVMPTTVFFRGQTASTQLRNSAGLRIGKDQLLLAAVVDTSGYSTAVQQKYQAYLLTEVPLHLGIENGSVTLPPGAYGFGFLANDRMTIMDLGGREILNVATERDAALARPNPMQILPGTSTGNYRLYMGRTYVLLSLSGLK